VNNPEQGWGVIGSALSRWGGPAAFAKPRIRSRRALGPGHLGVGVSMAGAWGRIGEGWRRRRRP